MKKMFIQPTDKMKKALEEEGLNIEWPKGKVDIEDFAIEGFFYTGAGDWEKIASIDLRYKEITDAEEADRAIAEELLSSYENYDVGEEFVLHQNVRGAPEAEELFEDLKEAEARLERFQEVAWAVVSGKPIPPEKEPNITISLSEAKSIVEMLSVGNPTEEIFKRNKRFELMNVLRDKIAEVE